MKKPISFTWSINKHTSIPSIDMWDYKGEKLYSFPACLPPKSAAKDLLGNNKYLLKERAKKFYEDHGILARDVVKIARGIVYNEVYKQFPEWYKLCRTTSWAPLASRFDYMEAEELLQQCRKDGIANIIPIVAYYGKSPQELKKVLGENKWKKLCKNSYSRNQLLFMKSNGRITPIDWSEIPSTILKSRTKWMPDVYSWLIRTQSKPLNEIAKTSFAVASDATMYNDTKRMCDYAGETFNPNWSKRRMKEEHDRLSRIQQEIANRRQAERDERYSKLLKIDFRELHEGLETIEFSSSVVAIPLVNMQQVQEEGSKMHHCVGSYARMCAEGDYLVWHLTKGDVETTLGISVSGKNKYTFSQHYRSCNSAVEDRDIENAAEVVVKMLNDKNKVKVLDTQEDFVDNLVV